MSTLKSRRILRNNINVISENFFKKILIKAKCNHIIEDLHKILVEFQKWTLQFLTDIVKSELKNIYDGSTRFKYITFDIKYAFGEHDEYEKLIPFVHMKRLVCEILQNNTDENFYVSKDGIKNIKIFYIENVLRLFYTIKKALNNIGENRFNLEYFKIGVNRLGTYSDSSLLEGSDSEDKKPTNYNYDSLEGSDSEDKKPKKIKKIKKINK